MGTTGMRASIHPSLLMLALPGTAGSAGRSIS